MTATCPYQATTRPDGVTMNYQYQAAPCAFNARTTNAINYIVLHYTECNLHTSLHELTGQNPARPVSVHYLIDNQPNQTSGCTIYQLVDEQCRAWHAGASWWRGCADINDQSIGIEIVNLNGNSHHYPHEQITTVINLVQALVAKYTIQPCNIIGHSDIAPTRKHDPGKLFPWHILYQHGLGAWPDCSNLAKYMTQPLLSTDQISELLHQYGYMKSTNAEETTAVIAAFQRHFRPTVVDGIIDQETSVLVQVLLDVHL